MWKLRPTMLLITVMALALIGCAAVMLAVSGPVARAIGEAIGAGDTALTVWNIARWPVVLVFVVLAVAILYYTTPNIQQPKFRWISGGAALAIVVWILVSEIFGFYVASFSSFNKTYGSLAGAIVLLLWLWIINLALLFGAELDSELERGRELQAGIAAEEHLQLPPRDTRVSDKNAQKDAEEVERGRELRQAHNFEDHAEGSEGVCTDVNTPKRKEMPINGPTHDRAELASAPHSPATGKATHIVTAASLDAAVLVLIIATGKRAVRRGGR